MHGRIRELAVKANLYVDVNGKPWPRNMNGEDIEGAYQKFAKLIVQECIAKAEEESERYLTWNTEDCNRFSKVMQNYKELLKEHFGVEE